MSAPRKLLDIAAGCAGLSAAQRGFAWRPDKWRAVLGSLEGMPRQTLESGLISRREPALLADKVARGSLADARTLLIAAMAWGFGDRGYGPWRTARMLETPGAEGKIIQVVELTRATGALAAYSALSGNCRLHRLGPVFATKLLYFCGANADPPGPKPVVLDGLVGRLLASVGIPLVWWRFQAQDYLRYLQLLGSISQEVRASPGDVECALFQYASHH